MLGSPERGEPLTIGEAVTAWRMSLRRGWTEYDVLREQVGQRVYACWAGEAQEQTTLAA
jgi:hypothetical protein